MESCWSGAAARRNALAVPALRFYIRGRVAWHRRNHINSCTSSPDRCKPVRACVRACVQHTHTHTHNNPICFFRNGQPNMWFGGQRRSCFSVTLSGWGERRTKETTKHPSCQATKPSRHPATEHVYAHTCTHARMPRPTMVGEEAIYPLIAWLFHDYQIAAVDHTQPCTCACACACAYTPHGVSRAFHSASVSNRQRHRQIYPNYTRRSTPTTHAENPRKGNRRVCIQRGMDPAGADIDRKRHGVGVHWGRCGCLTKSTCSLYEGAEGGVHFRSAASDIQCTDGWGCLKQLKHSLRGCLVTETEHSVTCCHEQHCASM